MATKSAHARTSREENGVSLRPANSILAVAGTAWDLDVTYKEAEMALKTAPSEENLFDDDVRFIR